MSDVIGTMSQKLTKNNVLLSINILTLIQDQMAANGEILCVCVCVCVCERERERERDQQQKQHRATETVNSIS